MFQRGLGSYNTGGLPAFHRDDKGIQHFEEVGLQALSPVTLMITHYSPIFLISFANIQLIIDIDKEKGIFFTTTRPSLPKEGTNVPNTILTFSGAEKEAKRHPPSPRPPPIWGGCNRSACRSYIKVSSTHHRVGMSFLLSPFPRGGDSRDVKNHRSPRRGKGFASDTKT